MDFFCTHISQKSIDLANQVFKTTWISEGKLVKEFEKQLSLNLGIVNPVAVNSGTSALHLALAIAGIQSGDEVILPAQTFVASGIVILAQGAKAIFADIDRNTGNISPQSIREKITEKTKAIMPVHWGGYPCNMDEISQIAKEFNLFVIEDAAHALGAKYKNKPIGTLSRFTAFSFQAIKHVTTGDGGALACLVDDDAKMAFNRRWFGIDRANSKPSILGEREYDISEIGYKYHMNDLAAAIGIGNLEDFKHRLFQRKMNAAFYSLELANVPGIKLLNYNKDRESAFWLYTILVERREDFIRKLAIEGIPASVVHLRIDHNSIFGGIRNDLPGQAYFNEKQVSIPVHEELTQVDINLIVNVIKSGW
jgi:perosamine synthetase